MSGAVPPKRERAEPASVPETARYIAELTGGLSALARGSGMDVLAYLLDIARLEAEEIAQTPKTK